MNFNNLLSGSVSWALAVLPFVPLAPLIYGGGGVIQNNYQCIIVFGATEFSKLFCATRISWSSRTDNFRVTCSFNRTTVSHITSMVCSTWSSAISISSESLAVSLLLLTNIPLWKCQKLLAVWLHLITNRTLLVQNFRLRWSVSFFALITLSGTFFILILTNWVAHA